MTEEFSGEPIVRAEEVRAILAHETAGARREALEQAGLFTAAGTQALLSYAQNIVGQDPELTRTIAGLCIAIAPQTGAGSIIPMALYTQAQTHAINGEFSHARELIEAARAAFESQGDTAGVLRTNLGLMNVLSELGQHSEALTIGESVAVVLAVQLANPGMRGLAAHIQTNLGICYSQLGRFDEALSAYARAETHFAALDMSMEVAQVNNNRGIALLYLGRVRESIALFEAAVSIREAANMPFLHAQALANLGEARLLLGEFGPALQALENARTIFQQFPAAADLLIVTRKLGDAYVALNLLEEAQETYTEASALAATLNMAHVHGWILWGLGTVLWRTGVAGEAGERLAQAAEIFARADNRPLLSAVRLEQAALLEAQGDLAGARSFAGDAWALVAGSEWRVQQVYAALRQADLMSDDAAQAERWLQRAEEIGAVLDLPHLRFRVDARLGRLRSQQGNFKEAEALLLNAVEQVERIRGTLPQEALRTSFVQDKMAVYEDLLRLYLTRDEPGDLARAFDISERTRSRVLIDLVQGVVQRRLDLGNAEQAELEALQADLNALYNRLLEGDNEQRGGAIRPLAALEQEIQRLRLRAATRGGNSSLTGSSSRNSQARAGADIAGTKSAKWKLSSDGTDVRALLSRNSRLISYFSLDGQVGAFVANHGRLQVIRKVADIRTIQGLVARLNMQWERFRMGNLLDASHIPQLEQSVRRLLGELYRLLWQPLGSLLEWHPTDTPDERASGDQRGRQGGDPIPVTVIPHGILHQVPFHALYDGKEYLVERYALTYAPSATVHALCLQMPRRKRNRAVVVAVEDVRTPNVKIEADRVAALFPDCTTLSGDVATIERLREAVQGQAGGKQTDVVHLACHGLFRADNPIYSGLKLADGWLTASDLVEWHMDGALVVLSACESGRSRVVPGDELLGLPRSVLSAGARTVVVSQWVVQDDVAAELMVAFHGAYLEHENAAVALRDAQRSLAVKRAHPYFWAAFVVIGAS